jgi:hydroxymethylpyrimidine/phosphomethylpyrimidine kinase
MTDAPIPRALSIAGSDSGGGAGIQADLKTFTALGVYGMTAITAVTVQNTQGVSDYQELSPKIVADQIRSVAMDIGVDAAKTGMLASASIVHSVGEAIRECQIPNLVVDPVFVSKHGHSLLDADAVAALREVLLPLARIVTPNLHEAAGLVDGPPIDGRDGMREAAEKIIGFGPGAVLMKGGHLKGPVAADLLFDGDQELWLESPRIETPNTHGTGCVLSAAIAAHLARGSGLGKAVAEAKAIVTKAIERSISIGKGIGPVNPVWELLGGAGEQQA